MHHNADLDASLAGHRWSARQQPPALAHPLGVTYTVFMAVLWTGFSLALLFLSCRLLARFMGPRRLFWDDGFAIFAFALVSVTAALWQWAAQDMYYTWDVQAGRATAGPDFFDRLHRWLRVSLAANLCFYTSLLSTKLALLMFFRRLGNNVTHFGRIWWPVLLITLATWVAAIGSVSYECLVGPDEALVNYCNSTDYVHFTSADIQANCALDVLTDLLIMLLPMVLLRKVRIRKTKKLAFCSLFSLSIVTMTIAIVRAVDLDLTRLSNGQFDTSYLWMWSALEPCVAVAVACLSAFPQLFTQSSGGKSVPYRPTDTYLHMISRIRNKNSRRGQQADDTLLGLETVNDFHDACRPPAYGDPESQKRPMSMAAHDLVLVPGAQPPAVAHVRAARADGQSQQDGLHGLVAGPPDRITQKLEYRVDRNSR